MPPRTSGVRRTSRYLVSVSLTNIEPCIIATNAETLLGYAQGNVLPMVEIIGLEPMTSTMSR